MGRRAVLAGVIGLALGAAACDEVIENPIRPQVVTTPVVLSINIIGNQVDAVTIQLTAFAQFSDNSLTDVTNQAGWGSSNNAVATVTQTGLVTAVGNGQVEIVATFESVTGRFPLSVSGL